MVFEISRETDQKNKIDCPCIKLVSQKDKFTSAPICALITCASEAKQKIFLFFVEQKISRGKLRFFLLHYLWRTQRKSTKTITEQCFSCQDMSVCQKLARSYKNWKSGQKSDIMPFLHQAFNWFLLVVTFAVLFLV